MMMGSRYSTFPSPGSSRRAFHAPPGHTWQAAHMSSCTAGTPPMAAPHHSHVGHSAAHHKLAALLAIVLDGAGHLQARLPPGVSEHQVPAAG